MTWYMYSAVFKLEQLQLKSSLHIFLNKNMFYVLLNVYAFGTFICFGLMGFPFHIIMVYVLRSIYADYRSLFFDKTPFITDVLRASSRSPYGTDMW